MVLWQTIAVYVLAQGLIVYGVTDNVSTTQVNAVQLIVQVQSSQRYDFTWEIYIDGFTSKPHNLFIPNIDFLRYWIDMITLHNGPKFHTYRNIKSLLKLHVINIKYIKMRRFFVQVFGSPEYLTKWRYVVLT